MKCPKCHSDCVEDKYTFDLTYAYHVAFVENHECPNCKNRFFSIDQIDILHYRVGSLIHRAAAEATPSIIKRTKGHYLRLMSRINSDLLKSKKILSTVPLGKGFRFYSEPGNYTGITANSLIEFSEKLQKVPAESIIFHFQSNDFYYWITMVLGDFFLSDEINLINKWPPLKGERLRNKLVKIVEERISELKFIDSL